MNYLSRAYIYITFYGDNWNPNEFSNILKLNPSHFGVKGDLGKSGAILKDTFWEYKIKETNALEELEDSIKILTQIFEKKIELINSFIIEHRIKSKCYIVIKSGKNEDTGVSLDENFISFLHKLKMSIEINTYIEN